jgi:integrase
MKRNRRAGVEDRWFTRDGSQSTRHGHGLRWMGRYVEDGREVTRSFARKADAQAWIAGVVTGQTTETLIAPELGAVTFGSFYRDWSVRQVWETSTRRAMDLAAGSVSFGDVALVELRASHVEAWVKTMIDDGLAATTIRTRFANVHNVVRAAVRDGHLARDVAERVRLPRARKAAAAMTIPTPAEVGAGLRAADDDFAAFVAVCAFAGLRRGEASALRVSDVDFLRREIHVQFQVQPGDGENEVRRPKYGSERAVYAPDGLLTILARRLTSIDPDRWLFPSTINPTMPLPPGSISGLWRRTGATFRMHDLRHFFASALIAAGCDVVAVQRQLGHANASITLATYSHLWPNADDRTRQAAGDLLAASLGSTADQLRTEGGVTAN